MAFDLHKVRVGRIYLIKNITRHLENLDLGAVVRAECMLKHSAERFEFFTDNGYTFFTTGSDWLCEVIGPAKKLDRPKKTKIDFKDIRVKTPADDFLKKAPFNPGDIIGIATGKSHDDGTAEVRTQGMSAWLPNPIMKSTDVNLNKFRESLGNPTRVILEW